jgi:hypothetical protein
MVVWLLTATVVPLYWLQSDAAIPHAIGFISALQHSFLTGMFIAVVPAAALFAYAFGRLPRERQQSFFVTWLPLPIAIGMIFAISTPVKAADECGREKHSVVALALAPLYWSKPHLYEPALTYEAEGFDDEECG